MLLDRLFAYAQRVRDFLIGPALQQMVQDICLAPRELKLFLRSTEHALMPKGRASDLHDNHDPGLCHFGFNHAEAA